MNLLNRLLVMTLLGTVATGIWAQPSQLQSAMKEAQREAKMQQQAEGAQRREQRMEAMREPRVQTQPPVAPPPPVAAPAPAPSRTTMSMAPNGPQPNGGPRRLTPEERQQLRDQIRDARRMYQQGQ